MAKEKFLLVSLSESRTKELAQAVSNETCRKILDYLAENEATESELAEKLEIPISTVHYNLQQLQKGGLVDVEEYHYSEKGKEVNHYSLSKKYIIIAPSTTGIKTKLKSILPMAIITVVGAGLIHLLTNGIGTFKGVAEEALPADEEFMLTAAETGQAQAGLPISLWFLLGGIAVIAVYLIISLIKKK